MSISKPNPNSGKDLLPLADPSRPDDSKASAFSRATRDISEWDDDFLPSYASGASDDGDLF